MRRVSHHFGARRSRSITPATQPPRPFDPGRVFDLTLPLDQAAEGYKAMDERAIKTLLQP